MNLFYQPQLPDGVLHLDPDESKHCIKVLRKRSGDTIRVTDGKGAFYDVVLTEADSRACSFQISSKVSEPIRNYSIHIAISPTKNADRIEWFVEKAVELGIDTITLLECKNTERSYLKTERLEKVAISAMTQSLKASLPAIHSLTDFSNLITTSKASSKFIAFVDHTNPHHLKDVAQAGSDYLLLIGPEGDFSSQELSLAVTHNFQKVSLGSSRLRTETAGMAACHILNLVNTN